VDPETIRRWARERKISSITLPGGGKRFRVTEVERVLNEGTVSAAAA
jgi:predicted site-specific integrase-resolvase